LTQLKGRVYELSSSPILPRRESLNISESAPLFEEFQVMRWAVVWRGSRAGFGADEFHYRSGGCTNVRVLIRDTDGNMFGPFTPVE
jgi:hypothetical protein